MDYFIRILADMLNALKLASCGKESKDESINSIINLISELEVKKNDKIRKHNEDIKFLDSIFGEQ